MKHLKLFEQSNNEFKDELQKFCNDYLAYLIDAGYTVEVSKAANYDEKFAIKLYKINNSEDSFKLKITFNWIDIKDDFIAFYEMLKLKYKLVTFSSLNSDPFYVKFQLKNAFSYKPIIFDLYDSKLYSDSFEKRNILLIGIVVKNHFYFNI